MCDEDGPSLPLDQQLLRLSESRFLHAVPPFSTTGLYSRCLYFCHDNVYAAYNRVSENACYQIMRD